MSDAGLAVNVVMLVTIVVGAVYAVRFRSSLDATRTSAAAWREERDAELARADRLKVATDAVEAERQSLQVELAELRGKTDLSALSKQIHETTQTALAEIRASFAQMSQEHEAFMKLFETEAARNEERHLANQRVTELLIKKLEGNPPR